MCVIIISGKKHVVLVEMGVDVGKPVDIDTINEVGDSLGDSIELLQKYCGKNNLFPGVPVCQYNSIDT